MDRFIRTIRLLGEERFHHLQAKMVTVVGLGAVGGYVVEGLVRAGVSHLRLVDHDIIEQSNLNRQIFALETTLSRPKAEVARERVLTINSACRVDALQLFACDDTLSRILDPEPDLLIDAIDSLNPKTQLLHEAYRRKIPVISSMGAALRTDPTLIRSGDIFSTSNCPLARHLRQRLRRRGVGEGISCVYSIEKIDFDYQETAKQTMVHDGPSTDRGRQRNVLGSLPTITGIFGLTIANQAIMRLSQEKRR